MKLLYDSDVIDLDDWFAEAEGRSRVKREVVARWMGITPPQLSQQLHKHGHVSLGRLVALRNHKDPDAQKFLRCLFAVASERLGFGELDPFTEALLTTTVTLTAKYRQAAAALAATQQERESA